MQKSNFCLHPVKGEFSKRNRKRPYKLRVDLLIACSNQTKQQMYHISLFFKTFKKRQHFIYIQTRIITKLKIFFSKYLSKDKTLCIHPHKDHYKVNLQRYFKTIYKHFKARQMIQTSELSN